MPSPSTHQDSREVREIETRSRRRIREAVESKGGTVLAIRWEPIRHEPNLGPVGGWTVEAEHPYQPNPSVPMEALGYNLAEVLEEIAGWPVGGKDVGGGEGG